MWPSSRARIFRIDFYVNAVAKARARKRLRLKVCLSALLARVTNMCALLPVAGVEQILPGDICRCPAINVTRRGFLTSLVCLRAGVCSFAHLVLGLRLASKGYRRCLTHLESCFPDEALMSQCS